MTILYVFLAIITILVLYIMIHAIFSPVVYVEPVIYDDFEDETTTTTTTTVTTTVDEPAQVATVTFTVVGDLPRGIENGQFYVIDPVDQTTTFLNPEDDLYEDANGEIWNVIDTVQA